MTNATMLRHLLAALLLFPLLDGGASIADEEPRPDPVSEPDLADLDDRQEILFLGESGPIAIRLRLQIDGESYRAPWLRFTHRLFREFDRNGNGLLESGEWEQIPGDPSILDGNTQSQGKPAGMRTFEMAIDLSPTDGLVTEEEFRAYLARLGGKAFAIGAIAQPPMANPGAASSTASVRAGAQLQKRLDRDADGRISLEEISNAWQILKPLDYSDDDSISPSELQPNFVLGFFPSASNARWTSRSENFVELEGGAEREGLARQLLSRYDRPEEGNRPTDDCLSEAECRFAPGLFQRCDRNADGRLDFEELQSLPQSIEPAQEIAIRLGKRAPQESAFSTSPEAGASGIELHGRKDGLSLRVGAVYVDLLADSSVSGSPARDLYRQQFQAADTDNNKYLEKKDVQRNGYFFQTFEAMDADSDGKLFEAEVLAYVDRRERAAGARCQMSVADLGRSLFEVFDSNRDGLIGPRELRGAAERLSIYDANHDGLLDDQELPLHLVVSFGRALPNLAGLSFGQRRAAGAPAEATRAPRWFERMDRNRDGDISRREFLGTRDTFNRLDQNHDGLLDASEIAVDEQPR